MKKFIKFLLPLALIILCNVSAFALTFDTSNTNPNFGGNLKRFTIPNELDVNTYTAWTNLQDTIEKKRSYIKIYNDISLMKNPYIIAFQSYSVNDIQVFYFSHPFYYLHRDDGFYHGYYLDKSFVNNEIVKYRCFSYSTSENENFDKIPYDFSFSSRSVTGGDIISSSSTVRNLNANILYCNFDLKDQNGNVIVPATDYGPQNPQQISPTAKWKNFDDRTTSTAPNEFLNLVGSNMNIELNTGTSTGRFQLWLKEVDDTGKPVGNDIICDPNEVSSYPQNQTINFTTILADLNLKIGKKYIADLKVDTGSEYTSLSKVGFIYNEVTQSNDNAKIEWTSFNNSNTVIGQYLPLNGDTLRFKLTTGASSKYTAYIQQYTSIGEPFGEKVYITSSVFDKNLSLKKTYDIAINLKNYVSLDKNLRYQFIVEYGNGVQVNGSPYVGAIGFYPFSNITQNPTPEGDDEIKDVTDNFPGGSGGGSIGGGSGGGTSMPDNGNIFDLVAWFFKSIANAFSYVFSSLFSLLNIIKDFCSGFISFLGSFFPYLPPELMICLSLSIVSIIALRFIGR